MWGYTVVLVECIHTPFECFEAVKSFLRISKADASIIRAQETPSVQEVLPTIGVVEFDIYGVCFIVEFHQTCECVACFGILVVLCVMGCVSVNLMNNFLRRLHRKILRRCTRS